MGNDVANDEDVMTSVTILMMTTTMTKTIIMSIAMKTNVLHIVFSHVAQNHYEPRVTKLTLGRFLTMTPREN